MEVFDQFFAQATISNIGSRLWNLLMEAGFDRPDCRGEYPMSGGSDSFYYEWIVESLRSILPRAISQGIVRQDEFDIDALEQQMREETVANNSCISAPALIGAFARLRI